MFLGVEIYNLPPASEDTKKRRANNLFAPPPVLTLIYNELIDLSTARLSLMCSS